MIGGLHRFIYRLPANGDYKTTSTLFFGKVDNNYNANFDEVRIWSVARTQQQINDYRFRNLDSTTGLMHYYPLDEGSGTIIYDTIGGKNGTLVNGPVFQSAASAPPITTPEDTPVSAYLKGSDVNGNPLTFAFTTNGSKGVANITNASTGAYTYTPNLNANGSDSFQYTVTDVDGTSAPATVNVTITPENDLPVGQGDHTHIAEDGILFFSPGVLANDTDVDGDAMTAKLVTDVGNGTLSLDSSGTFNYIPDANFNGTDSFTYKPNDGTGDALNAVTVTILVDPVNDAPVTTPDAYVGAEDTPIVISASKGVLANDRDPEGSPISADVVAFPAHGILTFAADGSFTYQGDPNFNGTDTFTYKAKDGADVANNGESTPETVKILVSAVNDLPVFQYDAYSVAEDGLLRVPAAGVLLNDFDADGNTLSVELGPIGIATKGPSNGVLTAQSTDGSFTYKPNPNFNGIDTFEYVVTDGVGHVGPSVVTITVAPVNDPPVANNDAYSIAEDGLLTVDANSLQGNLLANDSDAEKNTLSIRLVSQPLNGNVHLDGLHGDFTYTPNANFNGTDSFTYVANDGLVDSAPALVTITVDPENDSPVAQSDAYSVAQGGLLTVARTKGLLANDSDLDGNVLYVQLTSAPLYGALQMNLDGSFSYKHDGLTATNDSFSYKAFDGAPVPGTPPAESGLGNEVTVTITVNAVNHAPLGGSDTYSGTQDTELIVSAVNGVLSNDLDVDGDSMIALIQSYPANGALSFATDGSFRYSPARGFSGVDAFTYKALDGKATSAETTVTLTINSVNVPPLLGTDQYYTQDTQTLNVPAQQGVLLNDLDIDGGNLIVSRVGSQPADGTLHLNADGSFVYVPGPGFSNTDSFTYYATDGASESGPAVVNIVQAPLVNQLPTTTPDSYTVAAGGTLQVARTTGVLANDSDADGQILFARLVNVSAGVINLSTDGSFVFNAPSSAGSITFTYRADDGVCPASSSCPIETATISVIDDLDGVRAGVEDSAPNGGDGNGDGIADSIQPLVTSLPSSGGYLTVALSNTACSHLGNVTTAPDPGTDAYELPYGLLSFELACTSATLTVYYHGTASLAGATYRKLGPVPPSFTQSEWYSLNNASFSTAQVNGVTVATATFTLNDGQLGDDTAVDGLIVDAGGPGINAKPVPILTPYTLMLLTIALMLLGAHGVQRYRLNLSHR